MSSDVMHIEPKHQRRQNPARNGMKLAEPDITAIAPRRTLILAACISESVISGLLWKERKRIRRIMLLVAIGVVVLLGMASLVVQALRG